MLYGTLFGVPFIVRQQFRYCRQRWLGEGIINGPVEKRISIPSSVNILKITTSANKIHKIILDQSIGMRFDAKELEATHQESVSGWQNPLSCI